MSWGGLRIPCSSKLFKNDNSNNKKKIKLAIIMSSYLSFDYTYTRQVLLKPKKAKTPSYNL